MPDTHLAPKDSFTRANSNPLSQHKAISPELHSRPEPKQETSPEDFRLNGGLGPWAVRNAQVFPKLRLLSATPYLRFNLLKISLKSSTAPDRKSTRLNSSHLGISYA